MRNDQETVVSQVAAINYFIEGKAKEREALIFDSLEIEYEFKGIINTFKIAENIQWNCLEFKDNLSLDSKRLLFHCIGVIISSISLLLFTPFLQNFTDICILLSLSFLLLIWFGMCVINIVWMVIVSLSHDYNDEKMPNKNGIKAEFLKLFKHQKKVVYKRQWKM